jgi:hypothetical protein
MTPETTSPGDLQAITKQVPPEKSISADGLNVRDVIYESPVQRVDQIEMIGEEAAAGYMPSKANDVSAGIRYLHCSRTIHQLVTDRNRAVGLYLAVATLLWTASTALLNAHPGDHYIIPLQIIQRWCLPVTFGVLTVLAMLVAFLLVRTRVGLIYEVAKMNTLVGLPPGRVKRLNPLSIFAIMQLIISLAGGCSAGLFTIFLLAHFQHLDANEIAGHSYLAIVGAVTGVVITLVLMGVYIGSVAYITSDKKLDGAAK